MSFPPEDRARVGSWKPGHVHGQKEALLTLLEEAGAGELGSSRCFGLREEVSALVGQ